jgi:hypothetical protein
VLLAAHRVDSAASLPAVGTDQSNSDAWINLSGGRVILSVGIGVSGDEPRFWIFQDDPGRKVRAELLDEGLDMLQHLWRG